MNLILNYPNDKTILEDGMALFRAILIARSIDNLEIGDSKKQKVRENLIKRLEE